MAQYAPIRRLLSSTAATPTPTPIRIVSRRAWEARQRSKAGSKPKVEPVKKEAKPWPRNYQLAGYAALGVAIPYCFAWFLSMNETPRLMAAKLVPGLEDALRSHFGHDEQDAVTYYEKLVLGYQPPKKLDDEQPKRIREQQAEIAGLASNDVGVTIHVVGSGNEMMVTQHQKLSGSTRVPQVAKDTLKDDENSTDSVALDFDDLEDASDAELQLSDELSFASADVSRPIIESTHTFSSWYYAPTLDQSAASARSLSDSEIEINRLEYQIAELSSQLKDPATTRDLDDIQAELARAKADLRSLRWKRRLGMA